MLAVCGRGPVAARLPTAEIVQQLITGAAETMRALGCLDCGEHALSLGPGAEVVCQQLAQLLIPGLEMRPWHLPALRSCAQMSPGEGPASQQWRRPADEGPALPAVCVLACTSALPAGIASRCSSADANAL